MWLRINITDHGNSCVIELYRLKRLRHDGGCGLHQRSVKRRADRQRQHALGARLFHKGPCCFHRLCMTRYDNLTGRVVVDRANIGVVVTMRDADLIDDGIA